MNTILFLTYLFVAVFILLSMFLAILGEAQANLRDDQVAARKEAAKKGVAVPPEYGIIVTSAQYVAKAVEFLPMVGTRMKAHKTAKAEQEKQAKFAKETEASPVDRIEARQLQMCDKLEDLMSSLHPPSILADEATILLQRLGTEQDARFQRLEACLHNLIERSNVRRRRKDGTQVRGATPTKDRPPKPERDLSSASVLASCGPGESIDLGSINAVAAAATTVTFTPTCMPCDAARVSSVPDDGLVTSESPGLSA